MRQWLVQWTLYCQRVVEAEDQGQAIALALEQGPDPEGSELDTSDPPQARPIEDD